MVWFRIADYSAVLEWCFEGGGMSDLGTSVFIVQLQIPGIFMIKVIHEIG